MHQADSVAASKESWKEYACCYWSSSLQYLSLRGNLVGEAIFTSSEETFPPSSATMEEYTCSVVPEIYGENLYGVKYRTGVSWNGKRSSCNAEGWDCGFGGVASSQSHPIEWVSICFQTNIRIFMDRVNGLTGRLYVTTLLCSILVWNILDWCSNNLNCYKSLL